MHAYCAEQGHHAQNYTASSPKCVNCGIGHRTLAAVCPQRRELIKSKSKEIRERSSSRSRTYAEVTSARQQGQPQGPLNVDSSTTKKLVSKILTAIVYAHYVESTKPGSFQETMDKMFDLNGLPRVNFPTEIVATNLEEIYRDTMKVQPQVEREQKQQPREDIRSEDQQRQREDMQTEQQKQQRDSLSLGVAVQEQKRKKDMQQETLTGKQAQEKEESQAKLPQPPSRPFELELSGAVGDMVTE